MPRDPRPAPGPKPRPAAGGAACSAAHSLSYSSRRSPSSMRPAAQSGSSDAISSRVATGPSQSACSLSIERWSIRIERAPSSGMSAGTELVWLSNRSSVSNRSSDGSSGGAEPVGGSTPAHARAPECRRGVGGEKSSDESTAQATRAVIRPKDLHWKHGGRFAPLALSLHPPSFRPVASR